MRARLVWEVDTAAGVPLYRGWDLELAHEVLHALPPGARLYPVQPAVAVAGGGR